MERSPAVRILTFVVALIGTASGFRFQKAVEKNRHSDIGNLAMALPILSMYIAWPANILSGLIALLRLAVPKNQELDSAMTHFQHLSTLISSFSIAMWIGSALSALQGSNQEEKAA